MPQTWDTIVLGAGVFGLATARQLAGRGQRVVVLDRAPVGTEASGFALGRLDPLLKGSGSRGSSPDDQSLAKTAAQSQLALKAYADHLELLPELESETGFDIQFDDRPTVQLLYSEDERQEGQESAARWTGLGFNSEVIEADDVRRLDSRYAPSEFGAVLVHGPFFIDSLNFVRALESSARKAGVELHTATVSNLTAEKDAVSVHTDQGHYSASDVVIALGPWTAEVCSNLGVDLPIYPSKGEILRMSVPDSGGFDHHVHGPCSLVHKKDGQVWVAATAENDGFNREPTERSRDRLLANARQMMPSMESAELLRQTVCFRPATPDDMPVVGKLPLDARVWVASGGGGSGIMQCPTIGAEVARMVTEGDPDPALPGVGLARLAQGSG